jgi:lipid-binding SYLF domain-containing protein
MRWQKQILWGAMIFMLCGTVPAFGDDQQKARLLVENAQIVLTNFANPESDGTPEELLRHATGIAIFPNMFKGGFFVGGSYGQGIVMRYKDGQWKGPSFVGIGAGSIGLQFGLHAVDLVLVILGEETMDAFMRSKFKLGADAAVAAGPVGAHTTVATEILLRGGIYSYSRTKGVFIGFSLEGAGIFSNYKFNKAYYQTTSSPQTILSGEVEQPSAALDLVEILNRFK